MFEQMKIFFCILTVLVLFPAICFALPPARIVEQKNLTAQVIAVACVLEINSKDKLPHFTAEVIQPVKGSDTIKKNQIIRIILPVFPNLTGEVTAKVQGSLPVKVQQGDWVILYLNRFAFDPEFFEPLFKHLSVVTLARPGL